MINIVRFSLFAVFLDLSLGMHFHKDQDGTQRIVMASVLPEEWVAPEHNTRRKNYRVPELTWSKQLSDKALDCVKFLVKNSLKGKGHPCKPGQDNEGENIYWYNGGINYSQRNDMFKQAMNVWDEEKNYINFSIDHWFFYLQTNNPRKPIGHFTQLAWRSTTHVGCAIATSSKQTNVVCRYSPPGNSFTAVSIRDNVPRLIIKKKPTVCKADPSWCLAPDIKCVGEWAGLVKQHCPRKCKVKC